MNDESTDGEPTNGEAGPTADPGGRVVPAGALVVAIMVAAALGILAVVALTIGGEDSGDDVEAARVAAGRFGERLLTVDEDGLDEWKAGVLSLSTGGFAEEVDEVEQSFRKLISEAELDVRARVTEIFMGPIDDGQVSAVLLYDREIRDSSGARTESDRYVQMRLLRIDGEWLVDNVIDIVSAEARADAGPGTPVPDVEDTTTTTEGSAEG